MISSYWPFPILCAIGFATASIILKQSLNKGAGATRVAFITNQAFFFFFVPYWYLYPTPIPPELLWAPALAGVAAFVGAVSQFLALKLGDVSLATPLLGLKVLMVAVFARLILQNPIPPEWWAGAVLSALGVYLIGKPKDQKMTRALFLTVFFSLLSVTGFAIMDVLMAGWAKEFGFHRFVVIQQSVIAFLSLGMMPFFHEPIDNIPIRAWGWLMAASLLIILQFFLWNRRGSISSTVPGGSGRSSSSGISAI